MVETGEVKIRPVKDIERTGFKRKHLQYLHLKNSARRNLNPAGDISTQVQPCMGLDRSLVGAETRPEKKRETKADGCGVKGRRGTFEFYPEAVFKIKFPLLRQSRCSLAWARVLREMVARRPICQSLD